MCQSKEMAFLAQRLGQLLEAKQSTLSTAESCTGGGVAAAITAIPGSSGYFHGGIVAYTNEVKQRLLGVNPQTIQCFTAVSRETVEEMVRGAMKVLCTDAAIATSGIAGPGGGTLDIPVGVIWIAVAYKNEIVTMCQTADEGREKNVKKTIEYALLMLLEQLKTGKKLSENEKSDFQQRPYRNHCIPQYLHTGKSL